MNSEEKAQNQTKELYFSYFIGRCNPPHQGHFHMINGAITAARENSGKALILLGSGPKAKYGGDKADRRTDENPLTFDLKKEIIENNIYCENDENQEEVAALESVILEEPYLEIVEKTDPTTQVIEFVETKLKTYADNTPFKITVQHFCGEKELADMNKMKFYEAIQTILTEKITSDYNIVEIETKIEKGNVQNDNNESMSATEIRRTAFSSEEDFQYYSCLYGDDTKRVYDAIIEGKRIGEKTLKDYTDSKTRKYKTCKSEGSKKSACSPKPKPKPPKKKPKTKGGKRKTNKRKKMNKRKQKKTRKRSKTNKRKRRKTKRTNKRKNDLNK